MTDVCTPPHLVGQSSEGIFKAKFSHISELHGYCRGWGVIIAQHVTLQIMGNVLPQSYMFYSLNGTEVMQ